ncbi:hypothetical protein DOTSEDRAFT_67512 [Dothistroma septosporum NZE10]|uniref:Zn(2)-C6 fungal-type domain-containing protein n=1 Tax=Dothistroma septosporum (strain NZE10 / CBS 128990) TaxID=675120 RepID=N1Q1Y3_DOTSN|nr:hypothetical protein DOTSEDRAFT_67512 [Dothistroma septosporum NZE10]
MDSFHQQRFIQWQYPDAEASFVPVAQGVAYFHPPGQNACPVEQLDGAAYSQYVHQQPGVPIDDAVFRTPIAPASAYPVVTAGHPVHRDHAGTEDGDRRDKIRRTRTACEECRKRKQKCDGSEPCHPCSEQSTECRYRDVPPTKKDDTMDKMLQLAENYNKTLACLTKDLDVMSGTLRSIEQRLERTWQASSDGSGDSAANAPLGYRGTAQNLVEQYERETSTSPRSTSARQRRHHRPSARR